MINDPIDWLPVSDNTKNYLTNSGITTVNDLLGDKLVNRDDIDKFLSCCEISILISVIFYLIAVFFPEKRDCEPYVRKIKSFHVRISEKINKDQEHKH